VTVSGEDDRQPQRQYALLPIGVISIAVGGIDGAEPMHPTDVVQLVHLGGNFRMPAGYGTAVYYAGMTRRWRVGLVAGLTAIGLVASATGTVWASPNVLLVQPPPQTGR
jgi:hypothetical protein